MTQTDAYTRAALQNLFDNLSAHIYVKDLEGRYLLCNQQQAQSLKLDLKDILGKTDEELSWFSKEDAQKYRENDLKVIHSGQAISIEEPALVNGKHVTVLSKKTPLRNDKGEIIGVMGMSVDISTQKDAEKARLESISAEHHAKAASMLAESIINVLPGHVYWYDKTGTIFGSNEQEALSIGFSSAKEYIGQNVYALQPPENAELLKKVNDRVCNTGVMLTVEEPYQFPDGSTGIFLSKKAPWRDEQGHIIGVLGVSFDITREKKLEQALEQAKLDAETRLKKIINLMPEHVYWKDIHFKYQGCNQKQAESAGLSSPDDIVGKDDFEMPWKKEAHILRAIDSHIIETGEMVSQEEPSRLSDGRQAIFLSKKVPLKDEKGRITGILGISFDITDQKNAEQLRIEHAVMEQKMRTSTMLAASIAHELRTPLAAVDLMGGQLDDMIGRLVEGYSLAVHHGLINEPLSTKKLHIAAQMGGRLLRIVRSANTFIDMMLMKVRLEKPKAQHVTRLSICSAIEESLQTYPLEEHDRILIHWDRDTNQSQDFTWAGDQTLFNHIIFNLLKNALHYVKAAGKGEIKIWVERGRRQNQLHFMDTGTGIPATSLPHIFDPFYTETPHGTGVGLALCKMIMQEFNGEIQCQSVAGEYTHFILSFPSLKKEKSS